VKKHGAEKASWYVEWNEPDGAELRAGKDGKARCQAAGQENLGGTAHRNIPTADVRIVARLSQTACRPDSVRYETRFRIANSLLDEPLRTALQTENHEGDHNGRDRQIQSFKAQ